jgi:hypothetical protein
MMYMHHRVQVNKQIANAQKIMFAVPVRTHESSWNKIGVKRTEFIFAVWVSVTLDNTTHVFNYNKAAHCRFINFMNSITREHKKCSYTRSKREKVRSKHLSSIF